MAFLMMRGKKSTCDSGGKAVRLDFKLAILKSGRYQFEIAHDAGLSEGRLSRFVRGREERRPDEERRLRTVLGLDTAADSHDPPAV
jgi:hypothetical protein